MDGQLLQEQATALRSVTSLDLVIPCFNEEEMLPILFGQLDQIMDQLVDLPNVTGPVRVLMIDDGSSDRTWQVLAGQVKKDKRYSAVKLSRNYGQQHALLAGLLASEAEVTVSLDADLQDDIAAIPKMISAYCEGAEIVYGVRDERRSDTVVKRTTARMFYMFMRWMGAEVIADHADYRLMGRAALTALSRYGEVNLFLRGVVRNLGFQHKIVFYRRNARAAGDTKYPYKRLAVLAVEGITSFSTRPLRLVAYMGFLIAMASFAALVWGLMQRLIYDTALPGWASTVLPIYFLGGVQMIALGIIGEYVGKIYLETKRRPQFIVEKTIGLE